MARVFFSNAHRWSASISNQHFLPPKRKSKSARSTCSGNFRVDVRECFPAERGVGGKRCVHTFDLVITGEGRLDGQTVMGKAPIGVAKLSKEYGKPVLAFSGCVTKDASACNAAGIDAFFPILRSVVSLEEAMDVKNAAENMADTVEQAFRLFLLQ